MEINNIRSIGAYFVANEQESPINKTHLQPLRNDTTRADEKDPYALDLNVTFLHSLPHQVGTDQGCTQTDSGCTQTQNGCGQTDAGCRQTQNGC